MCKVTFEALDRDLALQMEAFFSRHLVELISTFRGDHERTPERYKASSAIILNIRNRVSSEGPHISRIVNFVDVPVLAISREPLDEVSKMRVFRAGAVDCLDQACTLRELLARVRARIRRKVITQARSRQPNYCLGPFVLHSDTRELCRQGSVMKLTLKEFALLECLIRNARAIVDRENLLEVINAADLDVNDRSVDSLISRLRRRIVQMGYHANLITTVRGAGYMLDADVHAVPRQQEV